MLTVTGGELVDDAREKVGLTILFLGGCSMQDPLSSNVSV